MNSFKFSFVSVLFIILSGVSCGPPIHEKAPNNNEPNNKVQECSNQTVNEYRQITNLCLSVLQKDKFIVSDANDCDAKLTRISKEDSFMCYFNENNRSYVISSDVYSDMKELLIKHREDRGL